MSTRRDGEGRRRERARAREILFGLCVATVGGDRGGGIRRVGAALGDAWWRWREASRFFSLSHAAMPMRARAFPSSCWAGGSAVSNVAARLSARRLMEFKIVFLIKENLDFKHSQVNAYNLTLHEFLDSRPQMRI